MQHLDLPEPRHLPELGRAYRHASDRREFRRALGLTALAAVVPGAGLTRTRGAKAGWLLVAAVVVAVGVAAWFVRSRGVAATALSVAASPVALERVVLAAAGVGIVWAASIVATAAAARPLGLSRARTAVLAAFTAVLVGAVGAGAFTVARVADTARATLLTVFAAAPEPAPAGAAPVAHDGGAQVVDDVDPWAKTPRVNVLLLGSDAGVGRTGTRTDSMIVASIDTRTGRTTLISLPRNLQKFPLPTASPLRQLYPSGFYGVPTCRHGAGDECMLNAIWTEASSFKAAHPDAYPGVAVPGRSEIRAVIGEILGLTIDHTVVVDLKGFERLVDVMGGVDVDVKLGASGRLPIGGRQSHVDPTVVVKNEGWFTAGRQHLSGHLALAYARARATDDDYARMGRQRCVLRAVTQQVNPARLLGQYAEVAQIARDNIYTDIPAAHLPAFVELLQRVQKAKMTSVALTPANGIQTADPDFGHLRELVDTAIQPPRAGAATAGTATTGPVRKPVAHAPASPAKSGAPTGDDC